MASILQCPEVSLREMNQCVPRYKNMLTPSKPYLFVMENYIEDVKQNDKHVPDLLESIMRPPGFVKEEAQPILFKI